MDHFYDTHSKTDNVKKAGPFDADLFTAAHSATEEIEITTQSGADSAGKSLTKREALKHSETELENASDLE
jgi:hypothetical protein